MAQIQEDAGNISQRFWSILTWQHQTVAADLSASHPWCKSPVPPHSKCALLDWDLVTFTHQHLLLFWRLLQFGTHQHLTKVSSCTWSKSNLHMHRQYELQIKFVELNTYDGCMEHFQSSLLSLFGELLNNYRQEHFDKYVPYFTYIGICFFCGCVLWQLQPLFTLGHHIWWRMWA